MMARMPECSSRLTSPAEKPSRLSISSCDSTRSPPFLPPPKSRLPSSTMAAHCSAMVPESSLAAAASAACAGSSESSEASHCAAMASWSTGSLPAMIFRSVPSLNDDFLEQHRVDLIWRNRGVDPPGQLFLEAKQARGAVEIAHPQLAQIGLKNIGDARHGRLDRLDLPLLLDLKHDLDLEILHALAGRTAQIDQHVGHLEEYRRLCRRGVGVHLVAVAKEQEPARHRAADHQQHGPGRDHQLEPALWRPDLRRRFRHVAVHPFVFSHRPARVSKMKSMPPGRGSDAIQCRQPIRGSVDGDAKVAMVNGTFLLPFN